MIASMSQDLLQPLEIEAAISLAGLSAYPLLYRNETLSTNLDVLAHFEQNKTGAIAFCEKQTAGRGRRGRHWQSPYAQNIYCTVGMLKSLPAEHLGLLSIVSGIALCHAIESMGIKGVKLKWPNDLVYQRNGQKLKLGGILIESRPVDDAYFLAIGFGLNVHMTQAQLDAIEQPAVSLDLITCESVDRQAVLVAAMVAVIEAVEDFTESNIESLQQSFSRNDAYLDQTIRVVNGDSIISGQNAGINQQGQLMLKTDKGMQVFSAAEISLRGMD